MENKKFEVTYIKKGKKKSVHYLQFQLFEKNHLIHQSQREKQTHGALSTGQFQENAIDESIEYLHIKNASFSCATSFLCPPNTLLYLESCIVENEENLYFEGGNVIVEGLKGSSSIVFKDNQAVDFISNKERNKDVTCFFDQVEDLQLSGDFHHIHLGSPYYPVQVKNIKIKQATNVLLDNRISPVHQFIIEDSKVRAFQFRNYDHLEITNSTIIGDIYPYLRIYHPFQLNHSTLISRKIDLENACYARKDGAFLSLTDMDLKGEKKEIRKMISILKGIKNEAVRLSYIEENQRISPFIEQENQEILSLMNQIEEKETEIAQKKTEIKNEISKQKIKTYYPKKGGGLV